MSEPTRSGWQMRVDVVVEDGATLPQYQSARASGLDLHAFAEHPVTLGPMGRALFSTGIAVSIPMGFEGQVRPRSGMAWNKGLVAVLGTIDSDYVGEICVHLVNLSDEDRVINPGDRIAQLVIAPVAHVELHAVPALRATARGTKGFGSTGQR